MCLSRRVELPNDIIHEILVTLPVKDLLRFRCLSKSLCATIDGPDLGAAHLNLSHNTNIRRKLVVFGSVDSPGYRGYDLDLDTNEVIKLSNPLEPNSDCEHKIVGSVNGLLLLYHDYDALLWNPFTRWSMRVPCFRKHGTPFLNFGLGYDSATNDYKVVTIRTVGDRDCSNLPYHNNPNDLKVRVFHVASHTWTTEVVQTPDGDSHIQTQVGVFANGALHWIWGRHENMSVLSMDISTTLINVNLFPQLPTFCFLSFPYSLQVLEGRVVLGVRCRRTMCRRTMLFYEAVDEGDGGGLTWRELYVLDVPRLPGGKEDSRYAHEYNQVRILVYSKDGKKILVQYPAPKYVGIYFEVGNLFWYDLGTRMFEPAHTPGIGNFYEATVCWESLV